jgi:TolB-like protein
LADNTFPIRPTPESESVISDFPRYRQLTVIALNAHREKMPESAKPNAAAFGAHVPELF